MGQGEVNLLEVSLLLPHRYFEILGCHPHPLPTGDNNSQKLLRFFCENSSSSGAKTDFYVLKNISSVTTDCVKILCDDTFSLTSRNQPPTPSPSLLACCSKIQTIFFIDVLFVWSSCQKYPTTCHKNIIFLVHTAGWQEE